MNDTTEPTEGQRIAKAMRDETEAANLNPPKPCPLCHSPHVRVGFLLSGRLAAITCLACGISLSRQTEATARAAWNKRPDDEPKKELHLK